MITTTAMGSEIRLYGRDPVTLLPYKKVVDDFRPYFCVGINEVVGKGLEVEKLANGDTKVYKSVFGDDLKKVFCKLPSEVPKLRTGFSKHFEADILYLHRYAIDRMDKIEKEPIKICYLDFEMESGLGAPEKFPSPGKAINKIISIGSCNSFTGEYIVWALCKKEEAIFEKDCGFEIRYFDDETEMISSWLRWINTEDFDMYTGYNIDGFDMPFLINRMNRLKMDVSRLTRGGKAYIDDHDRLNLMGRVVFDIYWGMKFLSTKERDSWKLGEVANEELGLGKVEMEGDLAELWRSDKKKFIEYNKRDVELIVRLDSKLKMIDFFDELRRIAKVTWECIFQRSMINDALLLQYCKGKYILPSVRKTDREEYEGAFIDIMGVGVYEYVVALDFKSLYPTMAMLNNISFETVVGKKDQSATDVIEIGNGVRFRKDVVGIVPSILSSMYLERVRYKNMMKELDVDSDEYAVCDVRQDAYKILLNSFCGLFGFIGSRIYNVDCVGSITFKGRQIIQRSIEVAESKGFKCLYAHTDSMWFSLKDVKDKEEFLLRAKNIAKEVENEVKVLVPKSDLIELELNVDKLCKSAFFGKTRNRNAGLVIWEKGKWLKEEKLSITGFEAKRSDTPKMVREFLKKLFVAVLNGKTEMECLKMVNELKTALPGYELIDVGLPVTARGDVPREIKKGLAFHIKACVYANMHFDAEIKSGDKVRVVYVKQNRWGVEAIAFKEKLYEGLEVDWKRMWRRFEKKVETIWECMSWYCLKTQSMSLAGFANKSMVCSEEGEGGKQEARSLFDRFIKAEPLCEKSEVRPIKQMGLMGFVLPKKEELKK